MELGFGKKNKAFIHFLFQECWFNSIHQNISFIYLSYTWKTAWISFVNSYFLCKFFWVCLVSFYFCPSVFTKQPWDSPAVWKKEIKTWWVLRIWGGGRRCLFTWGGFIPKFQLGSHLWSWLLFVVGVEQFGNNKVMGRNGLNSSLGWTEVVSSRIQEDENSWI